MGSLASSIRSRSSSIAWHSNWVAVQHVEIGIRAFYRSRASEAAGVTARFAFELMQDDGPERRQQNTLPRTDTACQVQTRLTRVVLIAGGYRIDCI